MDYVLKLIEEKDENIVLSNNTNIVLVLGNYGVGTRIFTQFIAGDNKNLISKETGNNTGEYIIEAHDKNNINSSTLSATIVPQLIYDSKTNTAYYNCPGFRGPSNPLFEIASTYFTKYLIDHFENVKLIFLVNHHSVQLAGERNGFMDLVEYAMTLIKNIDKFTDGIAMISTKVANKYIVKGNMIELVSNKKIIENIVNYLEQTKSAVNHQLNENYNEKKILFENAIKFIDILIQKQGDDYPRLGLFRLPAEAGPLNNISVMQENKKILSDIIQNNLKFIEKNDEDFQYTISVAAKIAIHDLIEEINNNATEHISRLAQNIYDFFTFNEENFNDLQLAENHFESSHILMLTKLDNMKRQNNISDTFKTLSNDYNMNFSKSDLDNIIEFEKYIRILEEIGPNKMKINLLEWLLPFTNMVQKLRDDKNFYNNILYLKEKLSEYNIQRNVDIFNVKELKLKISQENKFQKLVPASAFYDFLHQIYPEVMTRSYDNIKHLQINQHKVGLFYEILEYSIENKPKFECNERYELTVRGTNVLLTTVLEYRCPKRIKFLKIYALNKIFIDTDFFQGNHRYQISIFAPIWETINYNTFHFTFDRKYGDFCGIAQTISKNLNIDGATQTYTSTNISIITSDYVPNQNMKALDYTAYLRENMRFDIEYHDIMKFHDQIIYDIILRYANTFVYIEVFNSFEEQFFKLKKKVNFEPLYQSFSKQILQYAKDLKNIKNDDKKALNYLYAAVLSRINGLKHGLYNNLIIDIKEFMNLTLKNIEKFEKLSNYNLLRDYNNAYKLGIDKKIDEASDLIIKYITPEITKIIAKLDKDIDKLLQEVSELEKQAHTRGNELRKRKEELEVAANARLVFGICLTFSKALSFFTPYGVLATEILSMEYGAVSLAMNDEGPNSAISLPKGVDNFLMDSKNWLESGDEEYKKILGEQQKLVEQAIIKHPEQHEFTDLLAEIKVDTNSSNISTKYYKIQASIKKTTGKLENTSAGETAKYIENIERVNIITQMGFDIAKEYMNDMKKISTLEQAIKQNYMRIEQLKIYKEKIHKWMRPMIKSMQLYIQKSVAGSIDKSLIALDFEKWNVIGKIIDMKQAMHRFTAEFAVQADIVRSIEKLEEAMNVSIQIYQHIQEYSEQKTFADYIYNINSIGSTNIVVRDEQLNAAINKLALKIQQHLIFDQYERVVVSLKQFIFPFAGLYFDQFEFPEELLIKNDTVTNLISIVSDKIESFKSKLIEGDVGIFKKSAFVISGYFNSTQPLGPFYVWKNKIYNKIIGNMLGGKEVLLKADVTSNNKNAVKFNKIYLQLAIKDKILDQQLQRDLFNYSISLTHLGTSYYKCDKRIYIIGSESQNITYSFHKVNDEPSFKNEIYEKITKSNFILSPYTMWKVQIRDITGNGFTVLEKYKNYIDLELSGYGQYVESNVNVCNNDLEKYYALNNMGITANVNENNYHKRVKRHTGEGISSLHKSSTISNVLHVDHLNQSHWINSNRTANQLHSMEFGANETSKSINNLDLSGFNFTNTLALTNYLIRKFTGIKEKFYGNTFDDTAYSKSLAKSMEIIERFEKVIEIFARKKNIPLEDLKVDSTALIEPIKKEVINGNFKKIPKILYEIVIMDKNLSRFGKELYKNIESIKWI